MTNEVGLTRVLAVVRRHALAVTLVAGAGIAVGLFTVSNIPGQYQAKAVVRIDDPRPARDYVAPTVSEPPAERLASVRLALLARPVVERAAIRIGLIAPGATAAQRERAAGGLAGGLDARIEGTDTFVLTFLHTDRDFAQTFLAALLDAYKEGRASEVAGQARATANFFGQQVEELRGRVGDAEAHVERFRVEHDGALPEQLDANLRLIAELELGAHSMMSSLDAAEGRRRDILSEATSVLRTREIDVGRLLSDARVRYTPESPEVQNLEAELARVRGERRSDESSLGRKVRRGAELQTVEDYLGRTNGRLSLVRARQAELRARVETTAKNGEALARLSLDRDLLRDRLRSLMARHEDAALAAGLEENVGGAARVTVVEPAWASSGPVKPSRLMLGGIAICAALALALGAAFLLEAAERRVRDASDVRAAAGAIPILGVIPPLGRRARPGRIA